MTRNEIREWLDKFAAKEGKEEGFEDWFDAITGSISPTEDTAYAIEKFMEEHANNKAEEMAIGFGKWLTNSGNIKSHLIENAFEEYKQSLK